MAPLADERLDRIAEVISPAKVTQAAARVVDVPGTGPQLLGNLRRVDALVVVVDGFSAGADPEGDLERLELELLVADRDHVERRLERVAKQARSGEPRLREEVAELERVLAHLDAGRSLRDWERPLPPELEPLTTKPVVAVVNGSGGIDLKLEEELAELPEDEAMQSVGPQSMLELIENLSHDQQQVLTLKFVFNFPNAEVATILGKSEGAIKSLQHRALVSLQKQLQSP